MDSITQDMRYRQSLMTHVQNHGVSQTSRKYNKSRSYIYFWMARYDGSVESLKPKSKRPKHHPNQHTEAEIKLITDMRRRNPDLGMIELWHRMRQRGYSEADIRKVAGENFLRVLEANERGAVGEFSQPPKSRTPVTLAIHRAGGGETNRRSIMR